MGDVSLTAALSGDCAGECAGECAGYMYDSCGMGDALTAALSGEPSGRPPYHKIHTCTPHTPLTGQPSGECAGYMYESCSTGTAMIGIGRLMDGRSAAAIDCTMTRVGAAEDLEGDWHAEGVGDTLLGFVGDPSYLLRFLQQQQIRLTTRNIKITPAPAAATAMIVVRLAPSKITE